MILHEMSIKYMNELEKFRLNFTPLKSDGKTSLEYSTFHKRHIQS